MIGTFTPMEASLLNRGLFQVSGPPNKIKNLTLPSSLESLPRFVELPNKRALVGPRCVASTGGLVSEVEKELAEEGEEMMRWVEKCGCRGVVELLECLEKEAIMGEDEGKEPQDYSRRARIFDRSSRVFQALQERDAATSP